MEATKKCSRCGEVKGLEEFYPIAKERSKDGRRNPCKACVAAYNQEWYAALSPEKKERIKERGRKWQATHPGYAAKYYNEHREHLNQLSSAWRRERWKSDPEFRQRSQEAARRWFANSAEAQERKRRYMKKYYQEHREHMRATNEAWKKRKGTRKGNGD